MNSVLLILLLLAPVMGAVVCVFLTTPRAVRLWALGVSLATALVAAAMLWQFNFQQDLGIEQGGVTAAAIAESVQLRFGGPETHWGIEQIGFSLHLGVDSISLWLVVLTVLLTPLAIAASWSGIREREKEYYAWMLALLAAMLGVFMARDLLLFYIFFELTLIPMFFIIGVWGGPERRYAAGKFFLYTFAGSVFTLGAVIYLGLSAGAGGGPSFDLIDVIVYAQTQLGAGERFWVLMGFLAGFAVKVPLFPVHTWLPLAHTEAPTAGSVILAGVLLKLGTYGLLRLAVPIGLFDSGGVAFPVVIQVIGMVCIIGIIYGALVAWVQQDIKKLVAYSSVSHLGFCVLGLVALNQIGMQGSVLYMINHGISTGALFLVIGMIYERYHTRDIDALSGLAKQMPILSFFFVLFVLSSIGLPGTNGFVSEFLTILGAFTSEHLGIAYGVLAALGIILAAIYMLHMTAKVIWGPLKLPGGHEMDDKTKGEGHGDVALGRDIGGREISVLAPLAVLVIVLGVMPTPLLRTLSGPLELIRQPLAVVEGLGDAEGEGERIAVVTD